MFRESGDFSGNRDTWKFYRETRDNSGTLQKKNGTSKEFLSHVFIYVKLGKLGMKSSVNENIQTAFGVLGRRILLLMVAVFVLTHQRKSFIQNWMETLRNGHEAYGLTEKRLGEIYKCKVRAMDYPSKIKALEQRSSYFEKWQNEVAERLPGKKTASMEKYGTPRTKTMENTTIS